MESLLLSQPKLVIFDCDGVIVDSVMAHCEVQAENFAKYGLNITPQEVLSFGAGKMSSIGDAAERLGARLPDDWVDEIYREIYARLELGVPVIDGVLDVLDRLEHSGVPFCLASNGSEEKMAIMLEKKGVLDRFDGAIFSAHTIGIWKPDPGLFQHAASAMGVLAEDCVVIEDSHTGVLAAKRAQMRCFGYAPDGEGRALENEGAVVFKNMQQLPELLGL
ncbi:MAG: haloacid dehalogenase [Hyphomicrobiales bacterium]|nr:MAG: haloacid dehalogenase [Hyphomicrobiales bacterium]